MRRAFLVLAAFAGSCSSGPDYDQEALDRFYEAEELYQRERYREAAEKYEFTLRWRDRIMDAYPHLADCYERLGDPERAVTVLERYRRVDSANDATLWRLARLYVSLGRRSEAMEVYGKILELHPNDERAQAELARLKSKP